MILMPQPSHGNTGATAIRNASRGAARAPRAPPSPSWSRPLGRPAGPGGPARAHQSMNHEGRRQRSGEPCCSHETPTRQGQGTRGRADRALVPSTPRPIQVTTNLATTEAGPSEIAALVEALEKHSARSRAVWERARQEAGLRDVRARAPAGLPGATGRRFPGHLLRRDQQGRAELHPGGTPTRSPTTSTSCCVSISSRH